MKKKIDKKYYHYTSIKNWKKIKKQGLTRYPMKQIGNVKGIFLWKNKLREKSHAGAVLYQMATKNSEKVVLLEINCKEESFEADKDYGICERGDSISVAHNGTIEKLKYHSREKGRICFKNIPIKNIKLLKVYELKNAFK